MGVHRPRFNTRSHKVSEFFCRSDAMSQNASVPEVKRNLFFPGQQLTAEDLTDLNLANRELRWLHNRALHGWGIVVGFGAKVARRASVVTVEPGDAVDCLGRA